MGRITHTIRTGELRNLVTFFSPPTTPDALGGLAETFDASTWTTKGVAYAAIDPVWGREFREGDRDVSELWNNLTMRYDPDMVPNETDYVTCDGKTYSVRSILNIDSRNKKLQILIREVK